MFRWIPYTFVRTVLFFIGGVLLAINAPDLLGEKVLLVLLGILAVSYFLFYRFRHLLNPGVIALPLVFLLGYVHLTRQTAARDPDHILHTQEPIEYYKAVITRFAEEKARSWKVEGQVLAIQTGTWQRREGKVIFYFAKDDFREAFGYGDVLLVKGHPQLLQGPGNPGEFDYRKFQSYKNIHHQHFVRGKDVTKIAYAPPSQIMAYAIRGRAWAESTLNKFVKGRQEQAIASALVLGVTDGLDNELLRAYSTTGSMHVLAVSGLHVSIIYLIILWVFRPVNKLPGGRWMVAIVSLGLLWMYAFVTGLSPSVLRAVTMFSFLAVARPWSKSTNVYNTLAVSAFFLLLSDPYIIMSVGFQLSYLAVLGIVYLYPKFLSLWEPGQWLWTEIWKLTCVSFAAQIATFSLGLLYFHQFPNYFLLSNLLVVPFSFLILILGLLVLAVSFMPVIAITVGYCLGLIIKFVNYIVFSIESLPFNVIDRVYITAFQAILLICLILFCIALLEFKKFKYLIGASFVVVTYAAVRWIHFSDEVNIQKFTVYNIPGHSAMDFIDGGQTFFLADSVLRQDAQKIKFHVLPNRLMAGVRSVRSDLDFSRALKGCRLISWKGKLILHITSRDFKVPGQLNIDWLVIGNNAVYDIEKITGYIRAEKVVLDSSNGYFFASHFLEEAKLYKLNVHSVLHHGAFALKIENRNS